MYQLGKFCKTPCYNLFFLFSFFFSVSHFNFYKIHSKIHSKLCISWGNFVKHLVTIWNISVKPFPKSPWTSGWLWTKIRPKTLKWKDGKLYAYPVQNGKWAARGPQCAPFPLSTWDAYLLWFYRQFGGRSQCCLFCFFVNSTMKKPNLSWSRARRVISYRCALIGEEMHALHCPIVR